MPLSRAKRSASPDLRNRRLAWTERRLHEIAATFTPTNDHHETEDS